MLSTNNNFHFTNSNNNNTCGTSSISNSSQYKCSPFNSNPQNCSDDSSEVNLNIDLVQKIRTYNHLNLSSSRKNSHSSNYERKFPFLTRYLNNDAVGLMAKKICDWVVQSNINGKNQQRINLLPLDKMEMGVLEILDTILKWIVDDMNEPPFILFIGIYFADRYVKRVGVRQSQVLWLILTSCIVALKMYSDSQNISNIRIGKKFDICTKSLKKMESEFLNVIGFNCYVEESVIIAFLTSTYMEYIYNITDKTSILISLIQQFNQQVNNSTNNHTM